MEGGDNNEWYVVWFEGRAQGYYLGVGWPGQSKPLAAAEL